MRDEGRLDPASLRLVAIADSLGDGVDGLVARAAGAVAGGATMLQLRLKDETPRTLVEVARRLRLAVPGVPLLVNDRADVALAAGAHGVHLGVDDLPPASLRVVVPERFLIGASARDAGDLARLAGADYVAAGPVFARGGAPALGVEGLRALVALSPVPVLAVGGVEVANVARLVAAGAAGVGVFSALFGEADPTRRARSLRDALDASGR